VSSSRCSLWFLVLAPHWTSSLFDRGSALAVTQHQMDYAVSLVNKRVAWLSCYKRGGSTLRPQLQMCWLVNTAGGPVNIPLHVL
jgi:hypothetical protein